MSIKNIFGIMSCKGGVGKSTLAVNLACSLSNFFKKKVGLLDADAYGPNHLRLLGISSEDYLNLNFTDNSFVPIFKHGVYSMSMGYFLNINSPVLWRGPMISNAIRHLFNNTVWGDLDVLIVDFPPGTGDIYLSLLRDIIFTGVILVTTPQILSVDDLRRSIVMLKKFNINICCLVENMTFLKCVNCNHLNYIYGNHGFTEKLANEFSIDNFYEIPLIEYISNSANNGIPFVLNNCDIYLVDLFKNISELLL